MVFSLAISSKLKSFTTVIYLFLSRNTRTWLIGKTTRHSLFAVYQISQKTARYKLIRCCRIAADWHYLAPKWTFFLWSMVLILYIIHLRNQIYLCNIIWWYDLYGILVLNIIIIRKLISVSQMCFYVWSGIRKLQILFSVKCNSCRNHISSDYVSYQHAALLI